MKILLSILLILFVTGCATSQGFNRDNLRGQIRGDVVVSDEDIASALKLKPQLPGQYKLAVYFSQPRLGGGGWNYQGASKWTVEDKKRLLAFSDDLIGKKVISDVIPINDSIIEGTGEKSIRLAAARAGADAVLVIDCVTAIDRYNNVLGATYFLLITPFFIPGTVVDGIFVANASMWDVRNRYLYLSVEAEGTASETRPAFLANENRVIESAKAEAVLALAKDLSERLQKMGGAK